MKKLNATIVAGALFACSLHGIADQALNRAVTDGARAKLILRVVDQDGKPVPDARVICGFWRNHSDGGFLELDLTTDRDGLCTATGKCTGRFNWQVTKEGYYRSLGKWELAQTKANPRVSGGKWRPYGATHTIVLKQIRNPCKITAYPRESREMKIPVFDAWVGFDLEICDWVGPYGKGKEADVNLRFSSRTTKRFTDYKYVMEVCFTNHPYGGAYIVDADANSDLKSPYEADTNATFVQRFVFRQEKKSANSPPRQDYPTNGTYLVYRTRTVVDEDGNLKLGHYGKIQGPWLSGEKVMILDDGCFNPVPNDPSIEDGRHLRMTLRDYGR